MEVKATHIADVKIIQPAVYGDARGFFLETFEKRRYQDLLQTDLEFVQDNYSRSARHVLRGLHFQKTEPQGKLVRVVRGEVFDVAVDIRPNSPTYGQWVSILLSEENKTQLWVPPGLAHGFVVLSDMADFEYKCTQYYNPKDEACLMWNDPDVAIQWPVEQPILSVKDQQGLSLQELM
ncbi:MULTISPECIES: dTDP-4-dehydrorhamnose 3,5-epimerase [Pantoea]|uniref:dTDP-4-dehydrorhamnose 3,5-epimerase n=2 Tax=Pantoea stewartii TaxID=66269 RepID=H3RC26_PANSE|nr:dTDP-4-dehydrorhamnose 3,5-epimerase [Pantoea stewartii]ARF50077.1 dTDP-4-dehydrorhamnose 3,5-epimerase [Pantoea stewartii subsp. stewartii DC283]EHU00949.1 dTDP-4-dehydrorhamnose 3,5-epimerase [Pantoea stewartii subsp. stewartii DC283]KAB0555346.1 dTDP-4-dehydrorhamnose 3,5-epimerase [Pantoea stewartii subsp. stewartii]KHE01005.1 dTDP-4-dehydrorhamnose 3,5-epimerase [Pantoea stewartii]KHN60388.1 dTDP-4-dehydrorhamnose 3,5-epimerase [Pantoea stewartii]